MVNLGFLKKIRTYPSYCALNKEKKDILLSIVLLKTSHKVIEQEVIKIIQNLQKKQIKVIACSSMITGPFGYIPDMSIGRVESLQDENLDFSKAFPNYSKITFHSASSNSSPLFKDGILLTAKKSKAKALILLLNTISWHPKKIIMIDDQLKHLEPLEIEMNNLNIEFQGFQYQYIEKYLENRTINKELVDFQINHLLIPKPINKIAKYHEILVRF